MAPEHRTAVLVALIGAVATVLVALLQRQNKTVRATRTELRATRTAAERAAIQTAGNEEEHAEVAQLLERLCHELRETRRDIGGIREEQRLQRRDHQLLARRLDAHLEK